jgi:ferredoxin-NADP reductase
MVAGGSGITPMFQVCQAILRNPYDSTKVFLVYANRGEDDILLRDRLDEWARKEGARFKVLLAFGATFTARIAGLVVWSQATPRRERFCLDLTDGNCQIASACHVAADSGICAMLFSPSL